MLNFVGELRGEVLEATTEGKATGEDMQRFKEALEVKISQEEPIRLLLIFKNIDGITPKGLLEDMKLVTFIKSVSRVAIVADDTFSGMDKDILTTLIPGVNVMQYSLDEVDLARNWLQA